MSYQDYIKSELLILIPVLYFIGTGLKKSKVSDKYIPLLLGIISIFLSGIWVFATSEITGIGEFALCLFTVITQGILIAGASVYANQIYSQSQKEE